MSRTSNSKMPVVGAGLITLDLIVADLQRRQFWHRAGGTCANVLAILSKIGVKTGAIARIGRDRAGDILVADLEAVGVDCTFVKREAQTRTSRIAELMQPASRRTHRFLFTCPLCNSRLPRNGAPTVSQAGLAASNLRATDVFFFDRVSEAILLMAEEAKAGGAVVMFEPGKPGVGSRFAQAVACSDIVKYAGRRVGRSVDEILDYASTRPLLVVETLDGGGLRYRLRADDGSMVDWIEQSPYVLRSTVDSAGAGDWCSAGFIAKLLPRSGSRRWDEGWIQDALAFGQALAAASISFVGPRGYLEQASTEDMMRAAQLTMRSGYVPAFVGGAGEKFGVRSAKKNDASTCDLCLQRIPTSEPEPTRRSADS